MVILRLWKGDMVNLLTGMIIFTDSKYTWNAQQMN